MTWIPLALGGACCVAVGVIACAMAILPEARERIRRRSEVIAIQRAHIAELERLFARDAYFADVQEKLELTVGRYTRHG